MARAKKHIPILLCLGCLILAVGGCGSASSPTSTPVPTAPTTQPDEKERATAFGLTSPAFGAGESIPSRYTCDGNDISPPLQWTDPPVGAQGFAIIADDPDASGGTWVHWVLYNIPADKRDLPEAVPPNAELTDGSFNGQNSWTRLGYGGPCPPGGTHRYFFKLYALDTVLELNSGEDKAGLLAAMEGHILAQTELMGTYSKQ